MISLKCNECSRPLDAPPLIDIPNVLFVDLQGNRGAKNLHFCGRSCMISFLTKMAEKPSLVIPHAN